ncbi:ecto-ADP-ribosyltransferase 5-like isoform X2 [Erpetoichthys calabaricus]|uniref:NAD(P)(+)--arginine ADP-ribosyltransferase n=2 Tax=Erpetoichthys calabaricus TaxID=27687 RepID=A0A8C4RJB2_ERPCA|nr:ecto-ADP-ribosyltransferase 5-like isoform X2 [Erpetoichthys calabaricus]XP_051783565.1 ecto-ADP-ribosyltransferase 5-like isoform X2 [Erpetoichthys calabaricus]
MTPAISTVFLLSLLIFVNGVESSYMYENSYDDDYKGCREEREMEITEHYLDNDLNKNEFLRSAWNKAKNQWNASTPYVLDLNTSIAIRGYTSASFHSELNSAVQDGVTLVEKYHYRSIHFLLTKAIQTLNQGNCIRAYRGVSVEIRPREGEAFRFGRFASASRNIMVALNFKNATVFNMTTCHAADISNYSLYRTEAEVLIPPYEVFIVKESNGRYVTLESKNITVNYRCWPLNGSPGQNTIPNNAGPSLTPLTVLHLLLGFFTSPFFWKT